MGGELRDVPGHFSFRDAQEVIWDPRPSSASKAALECPQLPGFYSVRGFLKPEEVSAIVAMAERVCGGGGESRSDKSTGQQARSPTKWDWYQYESPARRVAPILVDTPSKKRRDLQPGAQSTAVERDIRELEGFEVFGGVPPQSWLLLSALEKHDDALVRRGGALLSSCVWDRMPALGNTSMQVPSFLQLQTLERGNGIQPHIDAAKPRAEAVATIGLQSNSHIRVGPVTLRYHPNSPVTHA